MNAVKKTAQKPVRTYNTIIKYECPVRGTIEQIVEVKVFKQIDHKESILSAEFEQLLEEISVVEEH